MAEFCMMLTMRSSEFRRCSDPSQSVTEKLQDCCGKAGGMLWGIGWRNASDLDLERKRNARSVRICAPQLCTADSLKKELALDWLRTYHAARATLALQNHDALSVDALASWSDAQIEVAIVAFPKSGTHSVGRLLSGVGQQVSRGSNGLPVLPWPPGCEKSYMPKVWNRSFLRSHGDKHGGLPCDVEDGFFHRPKYKLIHEVPTKEEMRNFNNGRLDAVNAPAAALRFVQEAPVAAYNHVALRALASIPKLRVIVCVRDPAEQFVSFYNQVQDDEMLGPTIHFSLQEAVSRAAHLRSSAWFKRGADNGSVRVPYKEVLLNAGRFAAPLALLRELFQDRLHMVHLDELHSSSPRMLKALTRFLGRRADVWRGHAPRANRGRVLSSLCGDGLDKSVLRSTLRAMLADEYEALYNPGSPFSHLAREPCMASRG